MILTYKVKHNRDFSDELRKAKEIADFAVKYRTQSSKDVKHIGLKSVIANQILRKYGRNKRIKKARKVNLVVPNQGIKVDKNKRMITLPCLKLSFKYLFPNKFTKINQIEIGKENIYVSVSVPEKEPIKVDTYMGVDLNATGHIAVLANPESGKVLKMGKNAGHIHKKYKHLRKQLQKAGKYRKVKQIKNRESRIIKDINHKISKKIIQVAKENKAGIRLEKLKGIRESKKHSRSFNHSLNNWSFYQLQQFIGYKAKLQGVEVDYIEPAYTSQICSRCNRIGNRNGKIFKCPHCGHVDHADSNASFNIALCQNIGQLSIDRDILKGNTDTPKKATPRMMETLEPHML